MGRFTEDQERFSDLIGLIYDTAQNPELWPELLEQLDQLIGETFPANAADISIVAEREADLGILRGHFQRALQLNKRLYDLKSERDAVGDILDRLPIGVILVDEQLIPVAINKHAEKILRSQAPLSLRHDKLCALTTTDTARIQDQVRQTIAMNGIAGKGLNLLLGTDAATPCSLHFTPSGHTGIESDKPLAAIFISCLAVSHPIDIDRLAEAYHLTKAEGRLLQALLHESHSLPEAAASLGVSKHTVRAQLKSILEKTSTHSQTELIKQVLTGPTALISARQETLPAAASVATSSHEPGARQGFRIIRLADGRSLEYGEHGDPDGVPVLFFHGCIQSRDKLHPTSCFAETHGIRLIAPQRPGFGESSLLPEMHEPSYYARDIEQLLQQLGLEKVYILADTSGAQAGFVCACFLDDRVRRMSAITIYPEPRFDFPRQSLKSERLMLKMYQSLPTIFHAHIAKIIMRELSKHPDSYFDKIMDQLPAADIAIVTSPEHRAMVAESFTNAYPFRIRGFTNDFMQRVNPWSFNIESCPVETRIWHGTANSFVPFSTAKKIAAALPKASLHPVQDGGHYITISHWDEILENLVTA